MNIIKPQTGISKSKQKFIITDDNEMHGLSGGTETLGDTDCQCQQIYKTLVTMTSGSCTVTRNNTIH